MSALRRTVRALVPGLGILFAMGCPPGSVGGSDPAVDAGADLVDAGSNDDDPTPDAGELSEDAGVIVGAGLPCEVRDLLRTQCLGCHGETPLPTALVSLVTRADLLKPSPLNPLQTLGQVSVERMRSTTAPMPPGSRLPENTVAPLAQWVAAGMPATSCGDDDPPPPSFVPLTRDAALSKVKSFLTGLAPSAAEYAAYRSDPAALPQLIDQWMTTPEFERRAQEMFELLFQQRSDGDDLGAFLRFGNNALVARYEALSGIPFRRYIRESFARTAWDLVARDRPFTEVLTTRTYMLNVPLMVLLAYRDGARPQDDLRRAEAAPLAQRFPNLQVRFTRDQMIPWAESTNPASANFGLFSVEQAPDGDLSRCGNALEQTYRGVNGLNQIFFRMLQAPGRDFCWRAPSPLADLFTAQDREFRPVTLELANASRPTPAFWDLEALRAARELRLNTEHVGFMGSLGFLGYWVTNDGNEYRGTANQALIVALGTTVAANDSNIPQDDAAVDEAHATPGSVCYGCHKTLDPLRDFFRQSYTYAGSRRLPGNTNNESVPAVAILDIPGSDPVRGEGVADLARGFATHSTFPLAWARKVCGLANAGRCSPNDPELQRIAAAFVAGGHDFKILLREVLSSPLVTHQARTASSDDLGIESGDALRDEFCRRLETRLGIADVCNLRGDLGVGPALRQEILGYARGIPQVSYPRGAVNPDMVTRPAAFTLAAYERLCEHIADRLLDRATGPGALSAGDREGALNVLVERILGLAPDDRRAAAIRATLDSHWSEAIAAGSTPNLALRSTFTLACTAPLTTGTGL